MSRRQLILRAGLVAAAMAIAPLAAAAAESTAQTRCRAAVGRRGAQLAKAAGDAAFDCVRDAIRAGNGWSGTHAAACLARADARLARHTEHLGRLAAKSCKVPPAVGFTDHVTLANAAWHGPRAIVTAIFGDGFAALTAGVPTATPAGRCHMAVASAALRLYRDWWKSAVTVLPRPLADAGELRDRVVTLIDLDRSPARPMVHRFRKAVARACPAPTGSLLAASCPTDAPDLATCVARIVGREAYTALAAALAIDVPCDLTDDGARNYSCVPPALAEHVLNRLGYGPDPWTSARLAALGVRRYVAEQLRPETIPDEAVEALLARYPSLTMTFLDLRTFYPNMPSPGQPGSGDVLKELQRAKLLRAIASRRQLEQVLVDFWFNHFNIVATDRRDYDVSPYERIAIRPHVLGRFRDLLLAVARSPGMGDFLDARRNRVGALNENFPRELLELHTVGVESDFTEADVVEVARAFTGWKENQFAPDGFEFVPAFHDPGPKTVLGTTLPAGGGYADGVAVLDLLASHPSTARRIVRKLVVRFVSETPPPGLVDAATATWIATGGDLRTVLETILLSPELLDTPANFRTKVKRPLHLLASIARATGADPAALNLDRMRRRVRELGEDLYLFPSPAGYPDASPFWTSAGTMVQRFNVADLAARGVDGIVPVYPPTDRAAAAIVDALAARYCSAGVSDETRTAAIAFVDAVGEADLGARRAAAAAILLSSPEFLVH